MAKKQLKPPAERDLRIYGIRHHGAGSARRLLHALQAFQPEAIAIELPFETDSLLEQLDPDRIHPPISFLYYQDDQPERSLYLPLAKFSPEYQAILYARRHRIPIHCMDLPAAASLVSRNFSQDTESDLDARQKRITRDPIAYLARLDGYSDSERWWEIHFEHWTEHEQLFGVIQDLMSELRKQSLGRDDAETLIREVFMRQQLRMLLRRPDAGKIAVVCGAWHGPVLTLPHLEATKGEEMPELSKVGIRSCIIPWTYRNMSLNNGYSAGIPSPVWHEALFDHPRQASSAFLVRAVHSLRKEGMEYSPSAAIDAGLLADNLALMRNLPAPGIEEMMDAATSVLAKGQASVWDGFRDKILCGEVTGSLELGRQTLPFVRAFHQELKTLRLSRFWKEGHPESLDLDLRKETQRRVSKFLHLSKILSIPWANERSVDLRALGSFHEFWAFHWHAELEIGLVERALYGNTLEEAAKRYVQKGLRAEASMALVSKLLEHALKSDFRTLVSLLADHLSRHIPVQEDLVVLSDMLRPLMSALEYGDLHHMDRELLLRLLDTLAPKLALGFPDACVFLDTERSKAMMAALMHTQLFFDRYSAHEYSELWKEQLRKLSVLEHAHPLLRGKSWSLLLERNLETQETFHRAFGLELSLHSDIPKAAFWFEGFLYNQSAFYLLHPGIIKSLHNWLDAIEPEHFKEHLPLLRRVFSQISTGERQRIFKLVSGMSKVQETAKLSGWKLDGRRAQRIRLALERFFADTE